MFPSKSKLFLGLSSLLYPMITLGGCCRRFTSSLVDSGIFHPNKNTTGYVNHLFVAPTKTKNGEVVVFEVRKKKKHPTCSDFEQCRRRWNFRNQDKMQAKKNIPWMLSAPPLVFLENKNIQTDAVWGSGCGWSIPSTRGSSSKFLKLPAPLVPHPNSTSQWLVVQHAASKS